MTKTSTVENLNGLIYERVYRSESFGEYGALGLELHATVGKREFSESDKRMISEAMSKLAEELHGNTIRQNPKLLQSSVEERKQILSLFDQPIYVETTKNEYFQGAWGEMFPWFIVTTKVGRIKIGWRKRVIEIHWTDTLNTTKAKELFPDEDVTKSNDWDKERYIHAWGLEKAKAYINKILDVKEKS